MATTAAIGAATGLTRNAGGRIGASASAESAHGGNGP